MVVEVWTSSWLFSCWKTGTSEATEGSTAGYVSSFVAVAPSDDPQLVVLLTLYNPQGKDHFGGHIAAPVVSQILSEVLPYLGIPSKILQQTHKLLKQLQKKKR